MMIDQKERNSWIYLISPFIVMEFCAEYEFNNGSYFKFSNCLDIMIFKTGPKDCKDLFNNLSNSFYFECKGFSTKQQV